MREVKHRLGKVNAFNFSFGFFLFPFISLLAHSFAHLFLYPSHRNKRWAASYHSTKWCPVQVIFLSHIQFEYDSNLWKKVGRHKKKRKKMKQSNGKIYDQMKWMANEMYAQCFLFKTYATSINNGAETILNVHIW